MRVVHEPKKGESTRGNPYKPNVQMFSTKAQCLYIYNKTCNMALEMNEEPVLLLRAISLCLTKPHIIR